MKEIELGNEWGGGLDTNVIPGDDKAAHSGHLSQVGRDGDRRSTAAVKGGSVIGRVGGVEGLGCQGDRSIDNDILAVRPFAHLDNIR